MEEQVFADGIGAITVIGGTVRLDLVTLSPTERDANGQPKAVFCQRVVMSAEGFLRSAGKVQEAVQAMSKMAGTNPAGGFAAVPIRPEPRAPESQLATEPATSAAKGSRGTKPPFP